MPSSGKLKFNIHLSIAILTLVILLMSSMSFAFFEISGIGARGFEVKLFRFMLLCAIIALYVIWIIIQLKLTFPKPILIFLGLIIYSTIVSVILNSPREYGPSLLRYFTYIVTFNLFYLIVSEISRETVLSIMRWFSLACILISIFFGFLEIFTGNVQYLNGAFRVAGPFKWHQLAFAMFLFCCMMITDFVFFRQMKTLRWKLFYGFIWLLLFYLLIRTGSRALFVIVFLVYFLMAFLKTDSFRKKLLISSIAVIISIGSAIAIVSLNISPRLARMIVSDDKTGDGSTASRIAIHINAYQGLDDLDKLMGVGLGGFTKFYQDVTGSEDIAAHNNYLMFFVESGYLGVILYLGFQIVLFFRLLRLIKWNKDDPFINVAFALFLGIDVLSFLQNNFYFLESETITWAFYGVAFGIEHIDFNHGG
ncbi:O-antigen ligase family protein [Marinoscillum sp.]|uniref:O-antigen ligase family protein n=1 Tax=Marinoscillum sp. TaxID=2024838 RepID=UPI003BAC0211